MHDRMRVLIDGRMLLGRFSGVARFVTRMVEQLVAKGHHRIGILCGDEPYKPWIGRNGIEMFVTDFRRKDRTALRRMIWESRRLPQWIGRIAPDVFHATWNSGIPASGRCPSVLTLHDLIPWEAPVRSMRDRLDRWAYRRSVAISARRATLITTVSSFSREQVLQKLNIPGDCVSVVHNGADTSLAEQTSSMEHVGSSQTEVGQVVSNTTLPYALYVGGFEPRKNVVGVLRAMSRYWERFGYSLELRLTGMPERLDRAAAEALGRMDQLAPIQFLGDPDDAALARQYRRATVTLLLSYDEGFGLPALEAMACGCPVIAANRAALPEVVGDAGTLVEPNDADAAACAIHSMVAESEDRDERIRRGLIRAGHFTWERTAAQFNEVYRRAIGDYGLLARSDMNSSAAQSNSAAMIRRSEAISNGKLDTGFVPLG